MDIRHAGHQWVFTKHSMSRMAEMGLRDMDVIVPAMNDPRPQESKKYPGCYNYRSGPITLGVLHEGKTRIVRTVLWSTREQWEIYIATHPEIKDREVKSFWKGMS